MRLQQAECVTIMTVAIVPCCLYHSDNSGVQGRPGFAVVVVAVLITVFHGDSGEADKCSAGQMFPRTNSPQEKAPQDTLPQTNAPLDMLPRIKGSPGQMLNRKCYLG